MRLVLLAALLLLPIAQAREDHASLASNVIEKDGKRLLALTIKHEPGWHTYWKNPGDAGIATSFKFERGGKPVELEALEWPAPERKIEAGDILTYGYVGDKTFFFRLPWEPTGLKAKVEWLICKDVCIPGGATLDDVLSRSALDQGELERRLAALPQLRPWPAGVEIYLSRDGDKKLRLDYKAAGHALAKHDRHRNLLTPFLAPPFGFKREELRHDPKEDKLVGKVAVEWDGEYQEPPRPLPSNGVFTPPAKMRFLYQAPDGTDWVIEKEFSNFSLTSAGLEEYFKGLSPLDGASKTSAPSATGPKQVAFMLLLAFLGGLILNLMPCVLPVISLKLFGLIKYQAVPRSQLLWHNLAYSAGVVSSFLVLALAVVAVKASGEAVGWGFQLQSPVFVLTMVAVLFTLALNLFGLFEFATPGGRLLGGQRFNEGVAGDFFTGVLSTILSTPCSAPFLGTALTFAFTGSVATILLTFAFVGLGLSSPFLLTGAFPGLISFIPRPGAWMEKLKYFLGLSMLLTVAWLVDVFLSLVDPGVWFWPLALILIALFFAFFFQARVSKNRVLALAFFLLPVGLLVGAVRTIPLTPPDRSSVAAPTDAWEAWSPATLEASKGQWVFIDFTAEWCLTCKVNKKLVLDTEAFRNLASAKGIKLLRADWTHRDDAITRFLEAQGVVGVPAYFLQKPDGSLLALGETISVGKVAGHVN